METKLEDMLDIRGPFAPLNELEEILAAAMAEEKNKSLWHYASGVVAARTNILGEEK